MDKPWQVYVIECSNYGARLAGRWHNDKVDAGLVRLTPGGWSPNSGILFQR